jgi:biopolymer transport protein ExbD
VKFYTKKRRNPAINIVSLIDILVILLIFFIVTATFKKTQPQVVINLPKSTQSSNATTEVEPLVITVSAKEEIFFEEAKISVEELGKRVKQVQETTPGRAVAMKADKGTPFGFIITIVDAMKGAGVKNLPAFTQGPGEE